MESNSILTTLQDAQAGNADGVAIDVQGFLGLTADVTASGFTGTVNFEGTIDDSNWVACLMVNGTTGAAVTTATAAGVFHLHGTPRMAWSKFRCRTSGVSAGTVTVKARRFPRAA